MTNTNKGAAVAQDNMAVLDARIAKNYSKAVLKTRKKETVFSTRDLDTLRSCLRFYYGVDIDSPLVWRIWHKTKHESALAIIDGEDKWVVYSEVNKSDLANIPYKMD